MSPRFYKVTQLQPNPVFEIPKMTKLRIVLKGEYSENRAIKMKWKITIKNFVEFDVRGQPIICSVALT